MPTPIRQLESVTSYPADGVTTAWNFSFASGYIDKSHVKAYTMSPTGIRTELVVTLGMFLGPFQLSITPAVTAGYELNIYRDTPTAAPLVDFTDTASFTELSLDTVVKQAIFTAAETADALSIASERVDQISGLVDAASAAATLATSKAAAAATSATNAATSEGNALASANSAAASAAAILPANLIHTTGNESMAGTKTFTGAVVLNGSVSGTGFTPTAIGLGNVSNTSDANKPVSTAQATAIGLKADATALSAGLALKADLAGNAAQDFSAKTLNGGAFSFRNKVRNPKMDIAQRGATFAGAAGYTLDGWSYINSGSTGVVTVSQQADAPAGADYTSSLRVAVTTADASVTAGKVVALGQPIEGYLVRDLQGNPIAIQFDVRSSKTGTHCVAVKNSGSDRSYVLTYTVNAANTWEKKTLSLPGGLITAGTWNWSNGVGIYLLFTLMAGTTFQSAAGAWQAGNFLATAAQVNCMDTVGNIFAIGGVQLEKGNAPGPLEHRDIVTELLLNQRYLYNFDSFNIGGNASAASQLGITTYAFPVVMRVSPTVASYGSFSLSNVVGATASAGSSNCIQIVVTAAAAGSYQLTAAAGIGYRASAEL